MTFESLTDRWRGRSGARPADERTNEIGDRPASNPRFGSFSRTGWSSLAVTFT